VVEEGALLYVRDGVLRAPSQHGCRVAFLRRGDSFGLVFGVWGKSGHVTAWKTPREIAGATEAAAMANGYANATIHPDGTLHLFS
jgi:hypothetical protein